MDSGLGKVSEPTAAELRRELRRKKILETAKSRLEKLNGKIQSTEQAGNIFILLDTAPAEALEYSDPEVEPNITVENVHLQAPFMSTFYPANTSSSSPANSDIRSVIFKSRIHIFIASFLGYILSHYAYSCLFAPVCLCILIEIFYYKNLQHNNAANLIVPIAILFTGASLGNKIRQINVFLSISHCLAISLGVNVFCICLSSISLQYFNENHVVTVN
ncbi:hypothetical protein KR222_005691 [Zaprionus bogoriensis]|nr:hypothetical protein KR222_005691 [Zaprionus bogoriensis]